MCCQWDRLGVIILVFVSPHTLVEYLEKLVRKHVEYLKL